MRSHLTYRDYLPSSLRRNWFVILVATFAIALGLGQLWFHRTYKPGHLIMAIVCFLSIAALLGFVVLVLALRGRITELRYRWRTRDVDRAMRRRR